jgi:hypothetical protein
VTEITHANEGKPMREGDVTVLHSHESHRPSGDEDCETMYPSCQAKLERFEMTDPSAAFTEDEVSELLWRAERMYRRRFARHVHSQEQFDELFYVQLINRDGQWCLEVRDETEVEEFGVGRRLALYWVRRHGSSYDLLLKRYIAEDGWSWERVPSELEEIPIKEWDEDQWDELASSEPDAGE